VGIICDVVVTVVGKKLLGGEGILGDADTGEVIGGRLCGQVVNEGPDESSSVDEGAAE
jgi:hypothetical protein